MKMCVSKRISKIAIVTLLLLMTVAKAHNVVGTIYVIADSIEGEVGYSNGVMADAGLTVTIVNEAGAEIGTTTTVDGGIFSFVPTTYENHTFIVDMGSGHKTELTIDKSELPDALKTAGTASDSTTPTSTAPSQSASALPLNAGISAAELSKAIEIAVAKQVKPLDKSINELKNKAGWRDVIGGIGYIFGLCGVGIWLTSRKNSKAQAQINGNGKVGGDGNG